MTCNEQVVQKPQTQNRDIRHLKRLVKGDGRLSAAKIALDLNGSFASTSYDKDSRSLSAKSCV